jgi:hypothetical protein
MTVLEHITLGEVRVALETHPGLTRAVGEISRRSGVPESVIKEHIGTAVLEALNRLGESYVKEMGDAIARVDKVRGMVHDFYDRVLSGQDRNPDTKVLAKNFEELHDAVTDITDPQKWAEKQKAAGTNPGELSISDAGSTQTPPADVAATPPTGPAKAGPRWEQLRDQRRIWALPEGERKALSGAREAHPDLVEAALGGDAAAAAKLADALQFEGLPANQIEAALAGLAAVGDPTLAYALGGELTPIGQTYPMHAPGRSAALGVMADLPLDQQLAVRKAAALDPEFVRTVTGAEDPSGAFRKAQLPWKPAEMDGFCAKHNIGGAERTNLETALRALNKANREAVGGWIDATSPVSTEGLSASARERAAIRDDAAAALGLPSTGKIAKALARAPTLREFAAENPDQFAEMAGKWLDAAAESKAKGKKPPSLRDYVLRIMTTHVRGGIFGEFTAVFRLGTDFWVLKTPDLNPTVAGTDFVVVARRSGEIWFCDNKTLSENSLSGVTSLVENFPPHDGKAGNLADDIAEFGPGIDAASLPVPPEIVSALANARAASTEISALVEKMSADQIRSPETQAAITKICFLNKVRRVVTNAGGELSMLSSALGRLGIDLANVESSPMDLPGGQP